jgi:cytoskeleton protein RodZ
MNQIGPLFRDARTESGKTIEDAVRETKIAKKYLVAIENENFDVFPGETYLLGFIRNYSQFLGLDPDEMILKYRDFKIQEQPAPIEQLTAKPHYQKRYVLIGIIGIIVISTVLYMLLSPRREGIEKRREKKAREAVEEQGEKRESATGEEGIIVFDEEEIIKDFKAGSVIEIPLKNMVYRLSIDTIGENLGFSIGDIPFTLAPNERVEVDFDRDGRKDVLLRTNRLGEGTANLTLKKIFKAESTDLTIGLETDETAVAGPPGGPHEVVIIKEDELFADIPVAPKTGFQILSGYEKTDISADIKGVSTAYLAYTIDDEERQKVLLRNGDELSFTAKDVLRLMVSNARGLNIQVNGVAITLGRGGQTVAKVIRWYRDSDDSDLYHLIIDDLEK